MKVSQIEDGIEFGITKLIGDVETPVWYFLSYEEIEILKSWFKIVIPGVYELHKEDTGHE